LATLAGGCKMSPILAKHLREAATRLDDADGRWPRCSAMP
jgi:hypothetical protein